VPANTWRRALETEPPESSGQGRRPHRPWPSVATWRQALDETAWRRMDVRAGSQGPLVVEVVQRRVVSRTHRRQHGDEAVLTGRRYRDRDQEEIVTVDDDLSKTVPETSLEELARVAKAAQRMEACRQRRQSEAGLADYAGRHGTGGHHHQTLSLLATWFLERETQRGTNMDTSDDGPADSPRHRADLTRGVSVWDDVA
jgi:hypothetical protein